MYDDRWYEISSFYHAPEKQIDGSTACGSEEGKEGGMASYL